MGLKFPIVLIHGLGARHRYGWIDYFYGIPKYLRLQGNELGVANLSSWMTVEHRGEQLKTQIDRIFPEGKVNLIGHSMGGLDARYVVSQLGMADRVASITTIGTPHRGTLIGDLAFDLLPEPALLAARTLLKGLSITDAGARQLTTEYASSGLSEKLKDSSKVAYFSVSSRIPRAALTRCALPIFWPTQRLIEKLEGDNDGFVSVHSATWGHHLATYDGDHYGQIGQLLGHSRGLDHFHLFELILLRLKSEGL